MTYAIRQARGRRRTSRSSTIEGRGRPAALRRHLRISLKRNCRSAAQPARAGRSDRPARLAHEDSARVSLTLGCMSVLLRSGCWRSLPPSSSAAPAPPASARRPRSSQKEIGGGAVQSSGRIRRAARRRLARAPVRCQLEENRRRRLTKRTNRTKTKPGHSRVRG